MGKAKPGSRRRRQPKVVAIRLSEGDYRRLVEAAGYVPPSVFARAVVLEHLAGREAARLGKGR